MEAPLPPGPDAVHFAGARCRACGEMRPEEALDEHRWCPACREDLERRIRWGKHAIALLITIPFGIWILVGETGGTLPPWAWLLPLAAAYYLGLRIGREALKGWARWRRLR